EKALLVTANYGTRENPGSSLSVVDLRRKRASRTIDLEGYRRPHGIQFFQDGERVMVTAEENQVALIVNIETEKIEKAIPTGQQLSHMVALSPDESRAYVSNIAAGTVSALDVREGRLMKVIPSGAGAEGIAVSPDAAEVWVTNRAEDTISVIDAERLEVVEKLVSESFPLRLKFTPDGEHVLVSNARSGEAAVFSVRERKEVARIPMEFEVQQDEERFLQFRLSPVPIGIAVADDGLFAYVANANADLIAEIDLTEWKLLRRLDGGHEPDGMALASVEVVK
ncbi:MAG TPA: beta-propeller fold lactonase family protein, partial [Acidobacteriota bacterium]|nr:beta-propeller fold lactonase family protein [Acidobacteriota bacterium]